MMTGITHRTIQSAGGLRMHIAEAGTGPLVLLLHGFPESWYSWRHQLTALAKAGYHAVAPDQRGYGATGGPDGVDQYTILHLAGDALGLLPALGEQQAVVVGHDWGAPVAWHSAMLRPDLVRGVAGLSVPPTPRGSVAPTAALRHLFGEQHYMLYFQQPGVAEAEFSRDLLGGFRRVLAGTPILQDSGALNIPQNGGFLDAFRAPDVLPAWISEEDLAFFVREFTDNGFTGPLNWYRNLDRNWELTAAWHQASITPPALLIAGESDLVLANPHARALLDSLPSFVPGIEDIVWLPDCGHWTQQERPKEVNDALIGFLDRLGD